MRLTRCSSAEIPSTGRRVSWTAALAAAAALGLAGNGNAVAVAHGEATALFCFGTIALNVNEVSGAISGHGNLTCDEPDGPRHSATIRVSGAVLGTSGLVTRISTSDTISYDDGLTSAIDVTSRLEKLSSGQHGNARGTGSGQVSDGRFVDSSESEQANGTFATGVGGTTTYRFTDFSFSLDR
ncbi:hypothetical protein AB0K09_17480 [Streptomyces sp. NPDC049577]|uniref:hypothetical protein n=1 Tax=Streptomyces sp. NPDC049577 TaxID=3155153 RepID=UPI003439F051